MGVLEKLKRRNGFTHTENSIADYILTHPRESGGMTLSRLSKETFSSNATIVRLCRKLGYSGYREFQFFLLLSLSADETTRRGISDVFPEYVDAETSDNSSQSDNSGKYEDGASARGVMASTAEYAYRAASVCLNTIPACALADAADLISHARRLYVYGFGAPFASMLFFCGQLSQIGVYPIFPQRFQEVIPVGGAATKEDVALALSASERETRALEHELIPLRAAGCRIILISAAGKSLDADTMIHFPPLKTDDDVLRAFSLQTAAQYILTCICRSVSPPRAEISPP